MLGNCEKVFLKIFTSMILVMAQPLAATQLKPLEGVTRWQLENGMTILTLKDTDIPVVSMYLFWRVGSRNEYPGITGLSHFFEHMMFNGSKAFGPGMFDQVMEAHGGANNAYTTEDLTVYTNWFPVSALEKIFELEADRISALAIDDAKVESERQVVASERQTGLENSNEDVLFEEVKGLAFRAHPYSWPVIGHKSDIESWTKEDLIAYHKTYYSPDNAVVVIVGDFQDQDVKYLVDKYFKPLKRGPTARSVRTIEPEQRGERRGFVQKDSATSANLLMAFHVPQSKHEDAVALDFLAAVLAQGKTSRLYKRLISVDKIATEVGADRQESLDPNLFYIHAIAMKGEAAHRIEQAIYEEISTLVKSGIQDHELQKIKNNYQMNLYRSLDTTKDKANIIGSAEVFYGDYQAINKRYQDFMRLTSEAVQKVASKYLVKSNRNVVILDQKEQ